MEEADNKAQKYIVTSVDEQPSQCIMNCETAKEMWNKMLSIYEQKSGRQAQLFLMLWNHQIVWPVTYII